jgi:hypothetical protein
MTGEEIIQGWLGSVDRVPENAYRPIDVRILTETVAGRESLLWSDQFFAAEAHPYLELNRARHSIHAATEDTFDLIRHDYGAAGYSLTVIETINFTQVRIADSAAAILGLSCEEAVTAVQTMVAAILNWMAEGPPWVFQLPQRLADGVTFSTNPDAHPFGLASWRERADGGIRGGYVYFLCFKKVPEILGYRNSQQWFDEDLRKRG